MPPKFHYGLEKAGPELFREIMPILERHKEEIAHYPDIELDPDWNFYSRAQEFGSLRVFTMRDQHQALVGYNIFLVSLNCHYKSSKQAKNDILYLLPELRRGRRGLEFINWCDGELKKEGVQVVYHHVKKDHNFGPALERAMGYELIDLIYGRRLDKWQ